jgi:hypothetical protein
MSVLVVDPLNISTRDLSHNAQRGDVRLTPFEGDQLDCDSVLTCELSNLIVELLSAVSSPESSKALVGVSICAEDDLRPTASVSHSQTDSCQQPRSKSCAPFGSDARNLVPHRLVGVLDRHETSILGLSILEDLFKAGPTVRFLAIHGLTCLTIS